jgi:hypothetical protein
MLLKYARADKLLSVSVSHYVNGTSLECSWQTAIPELYTANNMNIKLTL